MRATKPSLRPDELLFGAYRRRILALLLLHPEQSFYAREIGRLADVPSGSVQREVTALTRGGVLTRNAVGNQVRYQADRNCPIFEELAGIFRKTAGLADVLRGALEPFGRAVRLAFVFGSVAQGKERSSSDVDVMVVGTVPFARVVAAVAPASRRLRREVNPVAMTLTDFKAKIAAHDRFVTRILRERKIFLIGDGRELGEFAQDRAA